MKSSCVCCCCCCCCCCFWWWWRFFVFVFVFSIGPFYAITTFWFIWQVTVCSRVTWGLEPLKTMWIFLIRFRSENAFLPFSFMGLLFCKNEKNYVSLIMVTITRHFFNNIFQMLHLSAVKFYKKNKSFLVISKSTIVGEKSWKDRIGNILDCEVWILVIVH